MSIVNHEYKICGLVSLNEPLSFLSKVNQFPPEATELLFKLTDEMKELYETKGWVSEFISIVISANLFPPPICMSCLLSTIWSVIVQSTQNACYLDIEKYGVGSFVTPSERWSCTPCNLTNFLVLISGDERLKRRLMATLFYENSTRTACSFQVV